MHMAVIKNPLVLLEFKTDYSRKTENVNHFNCSVDCFRFEIYKSFNNRMNI